MPGVNGPPVLQVMVPVFEHLTGHSYSYLWLCMNRCLLALAIRVNTKFLSFAQTLQTAAPGSFRKGYE
jgi:hypothetical protein